MTYARYKQPLVGREADYIVYKIIFNESLWARTIKSCRLVMDSLICRTFNVGRPPSALYMTSSLDSDDATGEFPYIVVFLRCFYAPESRAFQNTLKLLRYLIGARVYGIVFETSSRMRYVVVTFSTIQFEDFKRRYPRTTGIQNKWLEAIECLKNFCKKIDPLLIPTHVVRVKKYY